MFNIKWGGIAAGAAFAVAFTLSLLLGQTSLLIALLRAVIFAAVFFGLGIAVWSLINTFIPELLSSAGTTDIATSLFSTGTAGSRVNITVDDTQQAALPTGGDDVGDFNDLFSPKNTVNEDSQDIDQTLTTVYTEDGETEKIAATAGEFGVETEEFASAFSDASLNENGGEEEETGEFSMDFSAFVPGGSLGGDEADEADEADSGLDSFSFFPDGGGTAGFEEPAPERKTSRNKPMKLEGDFDAKEIAAGLRTVLQKDKK